MTMYRIYNTEAEAAAALLALDRNMRGYAVQIGYEVINEIIHGKVDGETDLQAGGTSSWAVVAEVRSGEWGFPDPVAFNAEIGAIYMVGVDAGELIEIEPEPSGEEV